MADALLGVTLRSVSRSFFLSLAILPRPLREPVGLAYLLARRSFRGKTLVDLLVTLPLVLPPTVTGFYLIVLLGRRGWLGAPLYAATGWTPNRRATSGVIRPRSA